MTNLFISYSRRDIETAQKLTEALTGQGLDFWIDWQGIAPTEEWWKSIERGIEQTDNFLFVMSPDSIKSKICNREIEHAQKNGKRLIPVVVRDIQAEEAPVELQPLNWIFLRSQDDFDIAFGKLITAIKTDYDWVQTHRGLQVKALEWKRSHRENSLLLRDKELADAEVQLATNSSKAPYPTDLQREYVLASRQAGEQQRKNRLRITTVVAVALAGLAIFGFVQARLATDRANLAIARNAAIQAINLRDQKLDAALLLGVESSLKLDNYETRGVLFDNLRFSPRLLQFSTANQADTDSSFVETAIKNTNFDASKAIVSPDRKILALGDMYGSVVLWDIEKEIVIGQLNTGPDWVGALAFSWDNTILAVGTGAGLISLWDIDTQEQIRQPVQAFSYINSLAFSHDGTRIAFGYSSENFIDIFDLQTDNHQGLGLPPPPSSNINVLAFNPDDTLLASGSDNGQVMLWDLFYVGVGLVEPIILTGHNDQVVSLTFSQDGKILSSLSANSTQLKWAVDALDSFERQIHRAEGWLFSTPQMSPSGDLLAYQALASAPIVVLNLSSPYPVQQIIDADEFLTFMPDNEILTYRASTGEFTLWNPTTQTSQIQPVKPQAGVVVADYRSAGNTLAIGKDDGKILLWDLTSHVSLGDLNGHSASIWKLEFSSPNNLLVSSDTEGKVIIWDLNELKPAASLSDTNGVISVSPNGKLLAYANAEGIPMLFDLQKLRTVGSPFDGHQGVHSLSFNKDASMLATSGFEGSRTSLNTLENNIILWDITSRRPIGQAIGSTNQEGVSSFSSGIGGMFSPDGTTFVVYEKVGNIILWEVQVEAWRKRSCDIAGRNFTQTEWADFFPGEKYRKTCDQWPAGE